jgi:hypothetical protein
MSKEINKYESNILALGFVEGLYSVLDDYMDKIISDNSNRNRLENISDEQVEEMILLAGVC